MTTARAWTAEEVRALGVTTDLVTAGSVLGIGRVTAYALNGQGRFPTRVLPLGSRYRVPVSDLLSLLGLAQNSSETGPASPALAPHQSPAAAKPLEPTCSLP